MERAFEGIWIPKEIWLSKELKTMEKLFLVEIKSLDNEQGCFASNEYFADFFGLSKNRCSEIITSLKNKGYITVTNIMKKNTKYVEKRIIRVADYGVEKPTGIFEKSTVLSENLEDNNIINNINNNIINIVDFKEVIAFLNSKANTNYKHTTKKTQTLIKARLNEGFTIEDFKKVIDVKCSQWLKTDMEKYLRPETLFGTKFESYLNENKKEYKPVQNKEPVRYGADRIL